MAQRLFISTNDIVKFTNLNGNLDPDIYTQYIYLQWCPRRFRQDFQSVSRAAVSKGSHGDRFQARQARRALDSTDTYSSIFSLA